MAKLTMEYAGMEYYRYTNIENPPGWIYCGVENKMKVAEQYVFSFSFKTNPLKTMLFLKKIYLFLERREGREKGREASMCERYIDQLPLTPPQLGVWLASQACALT